MNHKLRIALERAIVTRVIDEARAMGFVPWSVFEGESWIKVHGHPARALEHVFSVDESAIRFREPEDKESTRKPADRVRFTFSFILGNGEDVIHDHTDIMVAGAIAKRVHEAVDDLSIVLPTPLAQELAADVDRLRNALEQIAVLAEYGTTGPGKCRSDALSAEQATSLRKSISDIARGAIG